MRLPQGAIEEVVSPSASSPPGMTTSKSSKSSSFQSLSSDDNSVLADIGHFEEIGLEDNALDRTITVKPTPNPYSALYANDARPTSAQGSAQPRNLSMSRSPRELASATFSRPAYPNLTTQRNPNVRSTSTSQLMPEPYSRPARPRSLSRSSSQFSPTYRRRSPSPSLSLRDPNPLMRPRRGSWQSNRERKTALELEKECDEDEGDDIPEGLILDNVPISPRPPQERIKSQPPSASPSPERRSKERVRSVGNGTPPVAVAHGSLRSPSWKSETALPELGDPNAHPAPLKTRAKSWTAALAELSPEAKELTEKLEEHAEELEHKAQRSSTGSMPLSRRSADHYESKLRHKSAIAELPPLRRTNIMIDPLPISKEKEAVLSRTRPSWLPPKDPAEERRHLREYQKMMAQSAEADKRREAARRAKLEGRDSTADSLMHLWEREILPRWPDSIRERRTRELWWRGVAPRSRGAVWTKAIGNELSLTEASYQAALKRAQDAEARAKAGSGSVEDLRHAAWFDAIRRDVEERTWVDLRIFQAGGPLHQSLVDILSAYSMYRSDIGYVTGCNTVAALLLLSLPAPSAAFVALANLLNRPLPLSFYAADPGAKASAYNLLMQTLARKAANLHSHLLALPEHDPDVYLADMFTALFTSHLPLDEVSRLWDVYVFEGDSILVRATIALLMEKEMALLATKSISEVIDVLGSKQGGSGHAKQKVLAGQGEEDRWMRAVREAGKA